MATPSNENPTPESSTGNAPENPPVVPATNPSPPTPANPPQGSGGAGPSFTEVMNGLNALPERIVDSLREAMQPATPPVQQPNNAAPTASSSTTVQTSNPVVEGAGSKPGKRSFADRWFGR